MNKKIDYYKIGSTISGVGAVIGTLFLIFYTGMIYGYDILESVGLEDDSHSSTVVGRYLVGIDRESAFYQNISLGCYGQTNEEIERFFYHELGHHTYRNYMTDAEKERWTELSTNNTYYITWYAETDIEDDFCETYSYYRMNDYYQTNGMLHRLDQISCKLGINCKMGKADKGEFVEIMSWRYD